MPPKQSVEESQSGSGAPRPATSRRSALSVKKIEESYLKPGNEIYRRVLPKLIYYEELKTIRREKPIVDPKDAAAPVVTVEIWERPEAVKEPEITTIDNDDEEEGVKVKPLPFKKTAASPKAEGQPNTSTTSTGVKRKACSLNPKPVRLTSTHNFTAIRKQLGYGGPIDQHFGRYKLAATTNFTDRYSKSDPTNPIADPDLATMLGDFDWSGFFKNHKRHYKNFQHPPAVLYKGFPMVEEVVFVMHPNKWDSEDRDGKHMDDGHCYWSSIALLIYGSASFWLLVKAEHLWYLESILNNPHHPRHHFYKRMMETKFKSKSGDIKGLGTAKRGEFNLWEALHIPGLWVNHDPCYLTADLYKVFLVLYKYSSTETAEVVGYDPPVVTPASPKRKIEIVLSDDDDPKPPNPKHLKVEKTPPASQTENAEATKPASAPVPAPAPAPAPKPTTPVKYIPRPPTPNCPVVIPPVGKAFEALCGGLEEAETLQGQTASTALTTRGPFGLTALSSRPPPDLIKLYTYFPHYDRQLLDSFYAWLIQPENIVKPVHQILDALELENQQFEQAKNPALAIRSLLGPTADIAAVVTLLTRYDFRLLLEFYSYEMKVENKAGKSAAQLLDELEKGHYQWTKGVTAPKHSGVHPGIIYTLEMMLGRYDPTLLADLAQWAKLSMSACAQAGQCQGLGKEKKWSSNAQLVQLLEEKHQQREEARRVEIETIEVARRFKDRLEQQDRMLAQHREWKARFKHWYFSSREQQFWSTKQDNTMEEVEMTGLRPRSDPIAMDLDEPAFIMGSMMGLNMLDPFVAPGGLPPDGTLPMDMGPEIDMDGDVMDMGADGRTEQREERVRYMEEAKLKVRDLTNIKNYKDLFISPRKPQIGLVLEQKKQAEKDLERRKAERRAQKPEEKLRERQQLREQEQLRQQEQLRREKREAKERGGETAAGKTDSSQLQEALREKKQAEKDLERMKAERRAQKPEEKQEPPRGRSHAGSASGAGPSGPSTSRPPGPRTPSRKREETRRFQPETENVIDENPMALVLARPRPSPPTLKLRPATPPTSAAPAGDDPFGPPPPSKDTTRLDPKRTAPSFSSSSNAPSSSTAPAFPAPRLDLQPRAIKLAKPSMFNLGSSSTNFGSSSNLNLPSTLKKPLTAPGKQSEPRGMQRFDINTAARHSNFNPTVGSKPSGNTNTLNPTFNPQPRGGPSSRPISGPSPGSSFGSGSFGSGSFGSGSFGSGSFGSGAATKPPTRTGRRINSNSSSSNEMSLSGIIEKDLNKISSENTNINPMKLALGGGASGSLGFGSLTDGPSGGQPQQPVTFKQPSRQRPKQRVERPRQTVARKPWLSDVQEVDEDLEDLDDGDLYGDLEGKEGCAAHEEKEEIKVEVQVPGKEGDVVDGSLRIEELGDEDADFYVDDGTW
ncbi:hypothetical protein N0V85_003825 [Neurospora sp. IMI 360204]|nr:hypothetical protein N0V85_003825 [Neurospora sp. IMI 360204]